MANISPEIVDAVHLFSYLDTGYRSWKALWIARTKYGGLEDPQQQQTEIQQLIDRIDHWIRCVFHQQIRVRDPNTQQLSAPTQEVLNLGKVLGDLIMKTADHTREVLNESKTEFGRDLAWTLVEAVFLQSELVRGQVYTSKRAADNLRQPMEPATFQRAEAHAKQIAARADAYLMQFISGDSFEGELGSSLRRHARAIPGSLQGFVVDLGTRLGQVRGLTTLHDLRIPEALRPLWEETGMPPLDAATWNAFGFDPVTAQAWMQAGLTDPAAAHAYACHQFTPTQATDLHRGDVSAEDAAVHADALRLSKVDIDLDELYAEFVTTPPDASSDGSPHLDPFASWQQAGFATRADIMGWSQLGFYPEVAAQWLQAGFSDPMTAALWSGENLSPQQAQAWAEAGFTPRSSKQWREWHQDPDQAQTWINTVSSEVIETWTHVGLTPRLIQDWAALGLTHLETVTQLTQAGHTPTTWQTGLQIKTQVQRSTPATDSSPGSAIGLLFWGIDYPECPDRAPWPEGPEAFAEWPQRFTARSQGILFEMIDCKLDRYGPLNQFYIPYAAVLSSEIRVLSQGSFTPPPVHPEWSGQLQQFCTILGIPWREPHWHVAAIHMS